jgi:hypothetical protein
LQEGIQPTEGAPRDEVEVRILTLADYAFPSPDGKLHILGAGISQTWLAQIPGPLGQLYLAARISIPAHMLGEPHTVSIRLLDLDRSPAGPDPVYQSDFELGRPPGFRVGDESNLQLAIQLTGYPVPSEATYRLHLLLDGRLLTSIPLKVQRLPPPTVALLG